MSGCTSEPSNVIHAIPLDIKITKQDWNMNIYPNPVRDYLIIEISDRQREYRASMLNTIGQLMEVKSFTGNTMFRTDHLAPGIYFLKLEQKGFLEIRKFIKR
jgi:hypothetical protein